MARKYQVISADGHVENPPESWVKYVPQKYKDRAPRMIKLHEGGEGWVVEGQPLMHNAGNITGAKTLAPGATGSEVRLRNNSYYNPDGTPAPGAGDAVQRLREQDQDGIDAEVLFPPVFATRFVEGIKDKDAYLSMVQAYNTFLGQDYCSVAPDRLLGCGIIPVTGIDEAVAELKRCKELGLKSVSPHQFPNGGGSPKPEDDKFWETALDLGMAVSPHLTLGDPGAPRTGGAGATTFGETISHAGLGALYCITQIIESGLLDRYPQLKIYFAETNAGWLPWGLFKWDDNYKVFHKFFGMNLKMLPSEYFEKHFLMGFIRDPVCMQVRDLLPMDNLMWGTDFPHSIGSFPNSRKWLDIIFEGVPASVKRKIVLENPARFYGLDLAKPITETPGAQVTAN